MTIKFVVGMISRSSLSMLILFCSFAITTISSYIVYGFVNKEYIGRCNGCNIPLHANKMTTRSSSLLNSLNDPNTIQQREGNTTKIFKQASSATTTTTTTLSEQIQNAVSNYTQQNCQLLGVKSIGVDYGTVRTGIAVSVGYNPKPIEIYVAKEESSSNDDSEIGQENDNDESTSQRNIDASKQLGRTKNFSQEATPPPFNNTTTPRNLTQLAIHILEITKREQAKQIIVGLPLHINGTENEMSTNCRQLATEIAYQILFSYGPNNTIPVYLWDERYTSKEAKARIHSINPRLGLYGTIDAEAACILLEHYYHDNGIGAELVEVVDLTIVEKYTKLWQRRQLVLEEQLKQEQMDRGARLEWKKQAMLRDQQQQLHTEQSIISSNGKKKKKKRKRKN